MFFCMFRLSADFTNKLESRLNVRFVVCSVQWASIRLAACLKLEGFTCCLFQFARQFYTAQWYRDCTMEAEKAAKKLADEGAKKPAPTTNTKQRRRRIDSDDDDDDNEEDDSDEGKGSSQKATTELDAVKEIQHKAEQRKAFLMQLMSTRVRHVANFKYD